MLLTSKHDPILKIFPQWETFSEDERVRARELLANSKKVWAHKELVQIFGLPCDSDTDGCNGNYNSGAEREIKV